MKKLILCAGFFILLCAGLWGQTPTVTLAFTSSGILGITAEAEIAITFAPPPSATPGIVGGTGIVGDGSGWSLSALTPDLGTPGRYTTKFTISNINYDYYGSDVPLNLQLTHDNGTPGVTTDDHTITCPSTVLLSGLRLDGKIPETPSAPTAAATGGAVLTPGYYNGANTGVDIEVTIPDDSSLYNANDHGEMTIQALASGGSWIPIVTENITRINQVQTVSISEADLASVLPAAEGGTVQFQAILTDAAGNTSADGTVGGTLNVDQTPPASSAITVDSAVNGTDNTVAGYWNGTNTGGLNVSVDLNNTDTSLGGGTVVVQSNVKSIGWKNVTSVFGTVGTPGNAIGTDPSGVITAGNIQDFADGTLLLRIIVTDIAGNATTTTAGSETTITIDTTPPTSATITVAVAGGNSVGGYWNSTNTGLTVSIDLADADTSLENGTYRLESSFDGINYDTVSPLSGSISSPVSDPSSATIAGTDITGFTDGTLSLRATVTDIAGNITEGSVTTLTVDITPPALATVSISSNNTDTTKAKVGNTVTVAFTANEALDNASVNVNIFDPAANGTVNYTHTSTTVHSAAYTLVPDDRALLVGGTAIPFTIDFSDAAGNPGTQVSAVTSGGSVTYYREVTWNGGVDTNWSTASNWNDGYVPGADDDVVIPTAAPNSPSPILTEAGFGNIVTINNSKRIDTAAFNFTAASITGEIRRQGGTAVTQNNGNVIYYGGGAIQDYGTTDYTNLTLEASGTPYTLGANSLSATTITNNGTLTLEGINGQAVTINNTPGAIGGTVEFTGNGTGLAGITSFNNLTIANTADITADSPLMVSGDVTVNGSFDLDNNNLTVGGNWTSTGGTFTAGTPSTVTFNGTGTTQSVNPAGSAFNNITVQSAGEFAVQGASLTAAGNITLDSGNPAGKITSTGATLTIDAQAVTATGTNTCVIEEDNLIVNAGTINLGSTAARNLIRTSLELNGVNGASTFYNASPAGALAVSGTAANASTALLTINETGNVSIDGSINTQDGGLTIIAGGTNGINGINGGGTIAATAGITLTAASGSVTISQQLFAASLIVNACTGITLDNADNAIGSSAALNNTQTGDTPANNILFINNAASELSLSADNNAANGNITVEQRANSLKIVTPGITATDAGLINIKAENGTITLESDVSTGHSGNTDAAPAVYFSTQNVLYTSGTTSVGTGGIVDLWVDLMPAAYVGYLQGDSVLYHLHIKNRHLVYKDGTTPVAGFTPTSDYFYVNAASADIGNAPAFIVPSGYNAYIIDVAGSTKSPSFTVADPGYIEFRGNYESSGTLTLNPGSGGIQLNNADITLTGNAFNTTAKVNLVGTVAPLASSITANGITLDAIDNTSSVKNDLTLATNNTSAVITVNGTVGSTNAYRPGNITVDNAGTFALNAAMNMSGVFSQSGDGTSVLAGNITTENTGNLTPAITFAGAITLAAPGVALEAAGNGGNIELSSTVGSDSTPGRELTLKTGAGDVIVSGAIGAGTGSPQSPPPLGNINITGNDITFNSTVTSSGKTTITNAALFTAGGVISSDDGFEQNGAGESLLSANGATITTDDNNITFSQNIRLGNNGNFTLSTGAGAGNITLAGVPNTVSPYPADITLTAGTGNITVSGAMGGSGAGERLGDIIITSAADARFNGAIAAQIFTQSAGTGTTAVNNVLNTNGPIVITTTGTFAVGTAGKIQPGGTTGTITVNGPTVNNGTITAGPVASGITSITFNGNYSVGDTTGDPRLLVGNSTVDTNIVFKGAQVTLGGFIYYDDVVVFSRGAGQTFTQRPDFSDIANALGEVVIETRTTVTVSSGIIRQRDKKNLTLKVELSPEAGNGGTLNMSGGSWRMLDDVDITPPFRTGGRGFAGFYGTVTMEAGTRLAAYDFYNEPASTLDSNTITVNVLVPSASSPAVISVARDMLLNKALGGVAWNSNPVRAALNATIEMTGTTSGNLTVGLHNGERVDIPNLRISGTAAVDPPADVIIPHIIIRGNVTITNGATLSGGNHTINVLPLRDGNTAITGGTGKQINTWEQIGTGTFNYGTSTVIFGKHDGAGVPGDPSYKGNTYNISGNTTWWNLVCHEPGAHLLFSNYTDALTPTRPSHTHTIINRIEVRPLRNIGGGVDTDLDNMIRLSRMNDTDGLTPTVHGTQGDHVPLMSAPSHPFWYFDLRTGARLDLERVYIHYCFSKNRIPIPIRDTSGNSPLILAFPYVSMAAAPPPPSPPRYDLGIPSGITIGTYPGAINDTGSSSIPDENILDNSQYYSFYNINWFVADWFFYSFTEDSDGNGKIDRIRAQAGFDLGTDFSKFTVEVPGYEVQGYERVNSATDCIYIHLKERPEPDGGKVLSWRIIRNESLLDSATASLYLANLPNDYYHGVDYTTTDTVPPRINYALKPPNHPELFFQMSEPVHHSLKFSEGSVQGLDLSGTFNVWEREFLITGTPEYTVADLAGPTPPQFELEDVVDNAQFAEDRPSNPFTGGDNLYNYLYPSPKYPTDWTYLSYVEIRGWYDGDPSTLDTPFTQLDDPSAPLPQIREWYDGSNAPKGNRLRGFADTVEPLPSAPYGEGVHRVTDILISRPPQAITDTDYFVWPLWAKYADSTVVEPGEILGTTPGYGYMGQDGETLIGTEIIFDFTGKRFLEKTDSDIVMQSNLQSKAGFALSAASVELIWATNISDADRSIAQYNGSDGLWYPAGLTPPPSLPGQWPAIIKVSQVTNLVPRLYDNPVSDTTTDPIPIPPTDPRPFANEFVVSRLVINKSVEFYYRLNTSPSDLLVGRLDVVPGAGVPNDWYRRVRPFSFGIHEITRQRGGVTILNNVIKAGSERVYIDYRPESSGRVTIQVFTLDGNLVKVLKRDSYTKTGDKYERVSWDGRNNGGRPVARGMYFVRVVAPGIDEIRKVMVVK